MGSIIKKTSASFLVLAVLLLSIQTIVISKQNQIHKKYYADVNDIKYGLFSVNEWKVKLSEILTAEINRFRLSSEDEKNLKPVIEQQIYKMIDSVSLTIKQKNKKTLKGRIKQAFINIFVDLDEIKKNVPQYASEVIGVMKNPSVRRNLKNVVQERVDTYFSKIYDQNDLDHFNKIIQSVGAADVAQARAILTESIEKNQKDIRLYSGLIIGLSMILALLVFFERKQIPKWLFILMSANLFILLVSGITIPMIDLEAKINNMSFVLLDQPIEFLNQIIYFQTKSVLDVFYVMISHKTIQMKAVGILLVTFSVIFPLSKLVSSIFYFYDIKNGRKNKWVQFFVLKSGKWSMADVMVIAIFMAYIGFNGVLASQFERLQAKAKDITFISTNGTSLQMGFYLFLAYVLLSLFLSHMITRSQTKESAS